MYISIVYFYFIFTGKNGVAGETPEKPGFRWFGSSFDDFDFTSDLGVSGYPPFLTFDYNIKGKNAKMPSAGGDGGCGGFGGHKGNAFVVELKKPPQFSIQNENGMLC